MEALLKNKRRLGAVLACIVMLLMCSGIAYAQENGTSPGEENSENKPQVSDTGEQPDSDTDESNLPKDLTLLEDFTEKKPDFAEGAEDRDYNIWGMILKLAFVVFLIVGIMYLVKLFWLRGMICLQTGDTTSALASFAASTELGDVADRYSGMSEREMENILLPQSSPVGWARTYSEYQGPVFVELTPMLGPDSLLRGSRVSWCDWNADGKYSVSDAIAMLLDIMQGNCPDE